MRSIRRLVGTEEKRVPSKIDSYFTAVGGSKTVVPYSIAY